MKIVTEDKTGVPGAHQRAAAFRRWLTRLTSPAVEYHRVDRLDRLSPRKALLFKPRLRSDVLRTGDRIRCNETTILLDLFETTVVRLMDGREPIWRLAERAASAAQGGSPPDHYSSALSLCAALGAIGALDLDGSQRR